MTYKNRSKGFIWFFNFVMRSEFIQEKYQDEKDKFIFLFDEPGAYLHVAMQEKICEFLKKLSNENPVIYCTHSYSMLEPTHINTFKYTYLQ